ncbi:MULTISPECIES: hypothetical protein [Mycobacteriaceae]|uniref:hypothetical protein n=1 Tax=Mycobacteriaceae TaxID=1762 RepID=UPI0005F0A708|nr:MULTISPECIES: hypothetical protein [Mycobacteriaceae]AMO08633.1 hypothetical protein MyAD_23470 [Mycolicibacterium neoaurum]AXK78025.1 hypothetical protein DXK33_01390 [Mycolicibacterium neoaurum]KUM08970.1 hypothetical protein AVZ31_08755 [Mycolicibacterium neoaurum]MDO3400066.1 hypothetical protein [Mycolicibacterium neoaurum]WBP97102.1 hypothetical protein O7W24_03755 [Mycolicibacterium neoaurum]
MKKDEIAKASVKDPGIDPPANPADATEATADQRQVQDQLDRRHEDPDGPGLHESRRQIADET